MVRTATLDFKPLLEAVRSIPGQEDTIVTEFENTFRSCVSSVDINLLLTGNIPQNVIHNSLISALQAAADYCLNAYSVTSQLKYRDIAHMLWNPVTATLFKTIANVQVTVSSEEKKQQSSQKSSDMKPALPKNQKSKSKPSRDPIDLSEQQIEGIRKRLQSVALTRKHLYAMTGGHPHVKCNTPDCSFCSTLFNNLNITRCEGHKRCCSTGWYPHIGVPLWNMVRVQHSSGRKNTIRVRPCKPYEIPALQVGSPVKTSPMESIAEETAIEDCTAEDRDYVSPASPAASVASVPSLRWSESVEEYYLSRKRLKRSTSVPPDISN